MQNRPTWDLETCYSLMSETVLLVILKCYLSFNIEVIFHALIIGLITFLEMLSLIVLCSVNVGCDIHTETELMLVNNQQRKKQFTEEKNAMRC